MSCRNSQTHFSGGLNILWNAVTPVRFGFNLDLSYAPLTLDGTGILALSMGPSIEMNATDTLFVGASLGLGVLSYQLDFDVKAADANDIYDL